MAEDHMQGRDRWDYRTPNMKMAALILEISTDPTKKDNLASGLKHWWAFLAPYHRGTENRSGKHYDLRQEWEEAVGNGSGPDTEKELGVIAQVLDKKDLLLEEFPTEGPSE